MVNDLHQHSFQGLWLDSIEKLFAYNLHIVAKSLREERGNVHRTVSYFMAHLRQKRSNLMAVMNDLSEKEKYRRMEEVEKMTQMLHTLFARLLLYM